MTLPVSAQKNVQRTHPAAVVADGAASSQAGVEVGDAVRAAHGRVLMDPAAAVDVATSRQIPMCQRQRRTATTRDGALVTTPRR